MIRAVVCMVLALLMASSCAAQAQCPALNSLGLVAHWKLDESGNTSTAVDTIGGHDGSLSNYPGDPSADWVSGKLGGALSFDGTDDYVNASNMSSLRIDQMGYQVSLSAWIYWEGHPSNLARIAGTQGYFGGYALWVGSSGKITFEVDGNHGNILATMDNVVSQNAWHHIVATFSQATGLIVYIDGEESASLTTQYYPPDTSAQSYFRIGNKEAFYYKGFIDDVRIYNRALSAEEVAALYAVRSTADAPEGYMTYDTRHARMIYCNGTNWVHMGTGSYNPNAVSFDGTNDWLQTGGLGVSDGTKLTGSFWFQRTDTVTSTKIFHNGGGEVNLQFCCGGATFEIHGENASDTQVLHVTISTLPQDNSWHHLMYSIDLSDAAKRHIYIDGVDQSLTVTTYNTAETIDFTQSNNTVFATGSGNAKFGGNVADYWMDFNTYIDLSDASNRRKFITAAGMPMYLGPDGSIPTGTAPDIFLSGDTANWHTNKGTGGGFTPQGSTELTTASSQPADTLIPAAPSGTADTTTGLIGHWELDESAGTNAPDISGFGYDGTLENGPVWQPAGGQVAGALSFDGVDDDVNLGAAPAPETNFSISAWVNVTSFSGANHTGGVIVKGDGGAVIAIRTDDSAGNCGTNPFTTGFTFRLEGSGNMEVCAPALPGQWYHLVMVVGPRGPGGLLAYVNGVLAFTRDTSAVGTLTTVTDWHLGYNERQGLYFNGLIDDVRIYNGALSAAEISQLYQYGLSGLSGDVSGNCANPSKPEGSMFYNLDYNVMQYCNGEQWIGIGK